MPRQARGEYLDPDEVQVFHAVQRCVRRAFLCGEDQVTGKSFEHRRLDEASSLACAAYVDLNPVRAALGRGRKPKKTLGPGGQATKCATSKLTLRVSV
jgi:hypothetical protein